MNGHMILCLCWMAMAFAHVAGQDTATIYVYAYSWTPGFCYNQVYPGCMNPLPYWETNLTIHGLWPQYAVSGYPASCTTEPFDNTIPTQIGESKMIQYWPDVQYTLDSSSYNSFWAHEWTKHGTCSGLTQLQYFNAAIDLTSHIPTPSALYESIGHNMSTNVLRDSFGGADYVALQCKNQMLNGIYTCWNQTKGEPTVQIKCPKSVIAEDTCVHSENVAILSI